jgi:acyl-coenzyme A thioesterase PaaI-like protein
MKLVDQLKYTLFIRTWGFLKVPMIAWLRPTVIEFTDELIAIDIPLSRRAKNHLNSMYFGAMCVGADVAGGILAMHFIEKGKLPVNLVFADLKVDFLKKAMGKTRFTCSDGAKIKALIDETMSSGERAAGKVKVIATCPEISETEPVAVFELTISLKKRSPKKAS